MSSNNIPETGPKEHQYFEPPAEFKEKAHIKSNEEYADLYRQSIEDPDAFWSKMAREELTWFKKWDGTAQYKFTDSGVSWFKGGKLNVSYNCIDRHLGTFRKNKAAIIWESESGETRTLTYQELHRQVCRFANLLKKFGVAKGDRVAFYLPMIPELAYTMLACARIGAVHSVIFAGFSSEAIAGRVNDAEAKMVITADEGMRGGKRIPLKKLVDVALEQTPSVKTVLVAKRTGADVPMQAGRDLWLADETAKQSSECEAEIFNAEDPLYILYTSGSTGKPKGVLHTMGGYLTYAAYTHELVFDLKPDDIFGCMADVGWVTGHTYVVYGPLANGGTSVMFESTPLYPDAGRYWQVVDDLKITIFYTAPTAIRALIAQGDDWVHKYSRDSIRILGTVGEPINPEVWQWYHDIIGNNNCAIVDTWWQTETGGITLSPLPGATPTKPGSATLPLPGIELAVVDQEGNELIGNDVAGRLVIKSSWPGQARTIWGDHNRYRDTYFTENAGYYTTGDGCNRDEDGYYWITGRVDDLINVSGHLLGTAEVESALVDHDHVAEAAVVGFPHELKGTGIYAYCYLFPDVEANEDTRKLLIQQVRKAIGPISTPDEIQFVAGLPKTRSGKIMRRILRKIAAGEYDDMGDTSTLADPSVVEAIIEGNKRLKG
ncbi:MAG: acetate--CoA ligase [Planctomycetes bacterium]|nr:acetate--CoA ligase [Planctomycetota bacterium]